MMNSLANIKAPEWLMTANRNTSSMPAIKELLTDSLYYPSSAFDGNPIAYLSGNFYSFIYVDYGVNKQALEENLHDYGFKGYERILSIDINEKELAPNGWTAINPTVIDGDPNKYRNGIKTPFAKWMVFQRHNDLDDNHGAERFSLFYLCADGVAAFQALYLSNNCAPLAVAIIQPGTGSGMNWTDFRDPNKIYGRSVLNNPQGQPQYLLYGGLGGAAMYQEPCWPDYSERLCFLGNTSIGIWQKNV